MNDTFSAEIHKYTFPCSYWYIVQIAVNNCIPYEMHEKSLDINAIPYHINA